MKYDRIGKTWCGNFGSFWIARNCKLSEYCLTMKALITWTSHTIGIFSKINHQGAGPVVHRLSSHLLWQPIVHWLGSINQKQRSCQTEHGWGALWALPWLAGRWVCRRLGAQGCFSDVLSSLWVKPHPLLEGHQRHLPYMVCFQDGVVTCKAACYLQNLKFF